MAAIIGNKLVTTDEMFILIGLDAHIFRLKSLQREHGLFLDLEEDKVRKKYFRTFPNGVDYLDFLYMICDMTNENVLNNEVVINDMNIMKEKRERRGIYTYRKFNIFSKDIFILDYVHVYIHSTYIP